MNQEMESKKTTKIREENDDDDLLNRINKFDKDKLIVLLKEAIERNKSNYKDVQNQKIILKNNGIVFLILALLFYLSYFFSKNIISRYIYFIVASILLSYGFWLLFKSGKTK